MFDYVVVDTPPGFTPEVIATIDNATGVVMVGMLDALSLKNTKLGPRDARPGWPSAARNVKLVLNRARSRVGISDDEVVAIMGREPDILVPSDRDIPRAVNEGKPILIAKPQAEASVAFRELAAGYLLGDTSREPQCSRPPQALREGELQMDLHERPRAGSPAFGPTTPQQRRGSVRRAGRTTSTCS